MPFGNITAQTVVYEPRQPGVYTRASVTFGQPDNSFVIRGATKSDPLRASVNRILQKDVVVAGSTVRKTCTITLSIVTPTSDFTSAEIDSMAADISEFLTAASVSRLLMGES